MAEYATAPLWRRDVARWTERRAQYLRSNYCIEYRHAITIAHAELGFSASGIAARTHFTETTVRGYLDELADRFCPAAVWTKHPDEIEIEAPLGGDPNA